MPRVLLTDEEKRERKKQSQKNRHHTHRIARIFSHAGEPDPKSKQDESNRERRIKTLIKVRCIASTLQKSGLKTHLSGHRTIRIPMRDHRLA